MCYFAELKGLNLPAQQHQPAQQSSLYRNSLTTEYEGPTQDNHPSAGLPEITVTDDGDYYNSNIGTRPDSNSGNDYEPPIQGDGNSHYSSLTSLNPL